MRDVASTIRWRVYSQRVLRRCTHVPVDRKTYRSDKRRGNRFPNHRKRGKFGNRILNPRTGQSVFPRKRIERSDC